MKLQINLEGSAEELHAFIERLGLTGVTSELVAEQARQAHVDIDIVPEQRKKLIRQALEKASLQTIYLAQTISANGDRKSDGSMALDFIEVQVFTDDFFKSNRSISNCIGGMKKICEGLDVEPLLSIQHVPCSKEAVLHKNALSEIDEFIQRINKPWQKWLKENKREDPIESV